MRRVRAERIATLYALIMNWQRCRDQAAEANAAWPWAPTLADVIAELKLLAAEQQIDLAAVPLPAIPSGK